MNLLVLPGSISSIDQHRYALVDIQNGGDGDVFRVSTLDQLTSRSAPGKIVSQRVPGCIEGADRRQRFRRIAGGDRRFEYCARANQVFECRTEPAVAGPAL